MKKLILTAVPVLMSASSALAITVNWTDWQTGNTAVGTAQGQINASGTTIGVNYSNANGYHFLNDGVGDIDYWQNANGAVNNPYTSDVVQNIPTAGEMLGLNRAGSQTVSFSEAIANPFISFVSLNRGNYWAFDHDFEILSVGSREGNYNGYFGSGNVIKQVVDLGNGKFEYRLYNNFREGHGTIRFLGAFTSITWTTLLAENWNGFTIGVEGTAREIYGLPDAGSSALMLVGGFGLLAAARRRFAV